MFQLIVAVISIALVAALAIASIYYGGAAFQKSSLKANVTTLVNGGQQIAGAQALYKTDNSGLNATDAQNLIDGEYLTALPGLSGAAAEGSSWALVSGGAVAAVEVLGDTNAQLEICQEADKQAGVHDEENPNTTWAGAAPEAQFGCFTTGGTVHFGFKL